MSFNNSKERILFIEICNFSDYPIGGYLSFAKQMITAFGNQLALVGMSTDNTPVGKWVKKNFDGVEYDFFSVMKVNKVDKKPIIPNRLKSFLAVKFYSKEIFSLGISNVFIQTPEVLFSIKNQNLVNLCTRIPGVENPLSISRYWYGKYFSKIFDFIFFNELKKVKVILASADKKAIVDFVNRSNGKLNLNRVIQFPTRVDTSIFYPRNMDLCRFSLNIPKDSFVISTTGRLSSLKGWKFMIDVFCLILEKKKNSYFYFMGDGEDRPQIENYINLLGISDKVIVLGRISHNDLSLYLNSSNVFIMGSYVEGWSTSVVEAIACSKPIVCTNFSSARELVKDNINGFVIENHDIDLFSKAILECNRIDKENLNNCSEFVKQFSTSNLKDSILNYWQLVSNGVN